jgi:hypothetical protein
MNIVDLNYKGLLLLLLVFISPIYAWALKKCFLLFLIPYAVCNLALDAVVSRMLYFEVFVVVEVLDPLLNLEVCHVFICVFTASIFRLLV